MAKTPQRLLDANARYYAENREKISAQRKQAWAVNPNREAVLRENRQRYHRNKEAYQPARDEWAKNNREKMLTYYKHKQAEHIAFLNAIKAGQPCATCNELYPPCAMDFDHVRGVKRHAVGNMTNYRRERVLEEIAKCQLLCCACHRVKTQADKGDSKIPQARAFHAWIGDLKTAPCSDCGRTRPAVAMDFDHRGGKVADISNMWSWRRERVQAELAKCDLVCACCHRVRTHERGRKAILEAA